MRKPRFPQATDSNTRERLPYEGDSLIAGHSRLSLQREFAWPQHSFLHNAWNPTSCTEWRQTLALLARLDYDYTGSLELLEAFAETMEDQTQAPCIDTASQLVNFSNCKRRTGGLGCPHEITLLDLIDTPAVGSGRGYRDGYVLSDTSTVISSYTVGSLRALSELHAASGNLTHARALATRANSTASAINRACVDPNTSLYTDGPTGAAKLHSAWHSTVFPAAFQMLPDSRWGAAMKFLREKRMAGGVYGAYWLLRALYTIDDDHGHLALEMLTQCDTNSWCNMLRHGATAVMEAWTREGKPNLSWSHPWASAPASAVAWGFFGIRPTAPGFKTFTVKPQPGNVTTASIKVPTLSGYIHVSMEQLLPSSPKNGGGMRVALLSPASTLATVCLTKLDVPGLELTVDGVATQGVEQGDYVCIAGLGSKVGGHVVSRGHN